MFPVHTRRLNVLLLNSENNSFVVTQMHEYFGWSGVLVILSDVYHRIESSTCPIFMITFPFEVRNVNTLFSVFSQNLKKTSQRKQLNT